MVGVALEVCTWLTTVGGAAVAEGETAGATPAQPVRAVVDKIVMRNKTGRFMDHALR
jgi:hypothetical protein